MGIEKNWEEYELIDTGGFEKLERFGKYVLRRPEPQAIWPKSLSEKEWQSADACFKRNNISNGKGSTSGEGERGEWLSKPHMPDQWFIHYHYKEMNLRFRLGMTAFKHVGLFPEQAQNWNYIYDCLQEMPAQSQVLNLFAYTGGASLAAKAGGAEVCHLDAVKQVLSWARENMEASRMDNIRWMLDDASVYVKREVRRGKKYQGIILDPPAYGRGPKGEKWILEDNMAALMEACSGLLDSRHGFLILNMYSMGFSPQIADNLLQHYFPYTRQREYGELSMTDRSGMHLPLSVYARFKHIEK